MNKKMERKIGEIFEYNGEWYQCVAGFCNNCDIKGSFSDTSIGICAGRIREDDTDVIFKKLEKVGEPYPLFGRIVQRYSLVAKPVVLFEKPFACYNEINKTIDIEIKKKQEDMEENTQLPKENNPLTRLVYNYVNGKISDKDLIESIKELPDKYPYIPNLKKFDLEAAKAGKPVCTRNGRMARIICFDKKSPIRPIIALIPDRYGNECPYSFYKDGRIYYDSDNDYDLMMLTEKHEGWVNIIRGDNGKPLMGRTISETEEKAKCAINLAMDKIIATIKINWKE